MSDNRPFKRRNIQQEQVSYINPEQHLLQRTLSSIPYQSVDEARELNDNLSSIGTKARQAVHVGYNRGLDNIKSMEEAKANFMQNQPKVIDNSQYTLPSYKRQIAPDEFDIEYRRVQTDIPGGYNQLLQQQNLIHQQYLQQQLQYQRENNISNIQMFNRPSRNINTGSLLNASMSSSGIQGLEYTRTRSSIQESDIELERRLSQIDEHKDKMSEIDHAVQNNPDNMNF
jgi:hypothetical protein